MTISVIIPFHEGIGFLKDCLESLKEQTEKDFEVLLVLDKKADVSEIRQTYEGALNLRVLRLEGKTGVAAARNKGLEQAAGRYVLFLDSDDYLMVDALERFRSLADENNLQFVYGKKRYTWYKRDIFLSNEELAGREEEEDGLEGDGESEGEDDGGSEEREERTRKLSAKEAAVRLLLSKKKGLQDVSALNVLWERSFLEGNGILFREDVTYYSDFSFVVEALHYAERMAFLERLSYIKRKHNDPINMPALSQIKDDDRFDDLVLAYRHAKEVIGQNSLVRIPMELKIVQYYASVFAPTMRKKESRLWREKRFQVIKEIVEQMDAEVINRLKAYKKKLIKLLMRGDVKKTLRAVTVHEAYRVARHLLKKPSELKKFAYRHYHVKKPVLDDYVMFECFYGRNYSDNPKYIFEYLNEHYPGKFRYVWVMNKKNKNIPYKTKQVKRFSYGYFKYMARCKYIVFNCKQPKSFIKRKGNVFLETWHGTPLKTLVFDMKEVTGASPLYKEHFYIVSRYWDYLISPNQFSTDIFRRAFMFDKEMLEFGYPRNDVLYREDKEALALRIKERLGVPTDKTVLLYAPTWRDDEYYGVGKYKFKLKLDLDLLKERLGDAYVVLLRTHYLVASAMEVGDYEGFAFQLSDYDDIAELYLISDILITDYSSVFFDYANLKRPMLFYTYDLEKYRDMVRGLYFNMEDGLPGPLLFHTEEVADAIENIEDVKAKYKDKYDEFYEKYCGWENGRASEQVVKRVFGLD